LRKYLDKIGFYAEPVIDLYNRLHYTSHARENDVNGTRLSREDFILPVAEDCNPPMCPENTVISLLKLMLLQFYMMDQSPPLLTVENHYLLADLCRVHLNWNHIQFIGLFEKALNIHFKAGNP